MPRYITFEVPNIKFYGNYPVGAALIHEDRRTDFTRKQLFMAI